MKKIELTEKRPYEIIEVVENGILVDILLITEYVTNVGDGVFAKRIASENILPQHYQTNYGECEND